MSLSFEVWLVLGIAAFYLYDSAILLYTNELILARSSGRWRWTLPGQAWTVRGKAPYLPNPLTPGTPVFRAAWSAIERPLDDTEVNATIRLADALRPLGYYALVLFGLMCELPPKFRLPRVM